MERNPSLKLEPSGALDAAGGASSSLVKEMKNKDINIITLARRKQSVKFSGVKYAAKTKPAIIEAIAIKKVTAADWTPKNLP